MHQTSNKAADVVTICQEKTTRSQAASVPRRRVWRQGCCVGNSGRLGPEPRRFPARTPATLTTIPRKQPDDHAIQIGQNMPFL